MSHQNAKTPHTMMPLPARWEAGHFSAPPGDWVDAAQDALNEVKAVADPWLAHPDTLTQHEITAYALALMHLRECASAAHLERLTDACDALAVTVSRLIENQGCTSRDRCETLIRFVAHAQAMVLMAAAQPTGCRIPRIAQRKMRL